MIYTRSWAFMDPSGRFRWLLGRIWKPGPVMHFVMLNPSTADAERDDPTIRKCVGFADRAGCGSIWVTNLFSFRATDPADLLAEEGPIIGDQTDSYIRDCAVTATFTVAAWGAHSRKKKLRPRARAVSELLRWSVGLARVTALKLAADGTPHHPLMLPYSSTRVAMPEARR